MYGLINIIVEQLVTRKFGLETWELIKKQANIVGPFSMYERYEDSVTFDLVAAGEKILGVPATLILELFGGMFYEYCKEIGYDKLLYALGGTPMDFLEQLDGLHDHLSSTFVGYRAPSFRVTFEEDGDGTEFYLHYYSVRIGLSSVVKGVLKGAMKDLFGVTIEINEANDRAEEVGEVCFFIKIVATDKEGTHKKEGMGETVAVVNKNVIPSKEAISPESFSRLYPFHITFNRELEITSVGNVMKRLFPLGIVGGKIDELFQITRPRLDFNFASILAHINTVYVLLQNEATATKPLKIKGRMAFQWQYNVIIFLCSPNPTDLQDLYEMGVRLADIPLHDASKELMFMAENFAEEQEISKELEKMTNDLQAGFEKLEDEKKKTDQLIYSVVPPAIADDLRRKKPIPSKKYEDITLMFSTIDGFEAFSASHEPLDIVILLNSCYTIFDTILDPAIHPKIYKVETIADCYIVVSGCPQVVEDPANAVVELAMDLYAGCEKLFFGTENFHITVGIHSGEIVAGIIGSRMPRYCLFGDTINTTSRTKTYGKKSCINLTQSTYDRLQTSKQDISKMEFTFHDHVAMKGKPKPMPVWLLNRKDPNKASPPPPPAVQPESKSMDEDVKRNLAELVGNRNGSSYSLPGANTKLVETKPLVKQSSVETLVKNGKKPKRQVKSLLFTTTNGRKFLPCGPPKTNSSAVCCIL
ncbi:hypothetical protein RvY_01514 [Ramazzottius varieornatus]|uniref:Guanylate cyclase soluble subunit beta-1 n=1 Tax=Ramazzottius varieornatus TaxID=947166 RepID=A0A1D1UGX3_RAMVA|nr:hypothetical protein RvY_01514 [Ramazzottius varieornatus]